MRIKIGQINAQRSMAAASDLEMKIQEHNFDILCIQEPYTCKGLARGYTSPSLKLIQPNVVNPWVAAVISNNKNIDIFQYTFEESEHMMCFQVFTKKDSFYVINVYCQCSHPIEQFLSKVENIMLRLNGKKIIITMDSNAKSEVWFSETTDERGKIVEEFLAANGMYCINKPNNPYTFSTINGESNIDVTFVSGSMLSKIYDWKVTTTCPVSDHNLIQFDIEFEVPEQEKWYKQNTYNLRKADWICFEKLSIEKFNENLIDLIKENEPHESVDLLNETLRGICDGSIPIRRTKNGAVPWWSDQLLLLRTEANLRKGELARVRRLGQVDFIEEAKRKYKNARNKYVAETKRSKKATWHNFVLTEGNKDPWSIIYKIAREKFNKPECMCSLALSNGEFTTNWNDTMSKLMDKCVPEDNRLEETDAHQRIRVENSRYINLDLEQDITMDEIDGAIRRTKSKKAPGFDGFTPEIIKALWKSCPMVIYNLFNNCLRSNSFPQKWKMASLKVILKDRNKDRTKLNSYRPIALLPVLGKIYERVIVNRLEVKYIEKGMQSQRQFGFRSGRSTEDAINKFQKGILLTEKKLVVTLFIDIEGAFDNLWWPTIKKRLADAQCSSNLLKIVGSYFRNRKMIVKSKNERIRRNMKKGCPQGSVIGPMAWNWCMDALLNQIENNEDEDEMEVIAYADDLAALIKGNSRREIETRAKRLVETIEDWCSLHKLKISTSKTVAMLMKGKLSRDRMPIIKINGRNVKYKIETRYLGIIIDEKMNFIAHAKYLRDKLTKFIMSIRRMAKEKWGLKTHILKILYKAVALPIACYGASVWFERVEHTLVKRQLLAAQRVLLLALTRACRTTATVALQIISGMKPLDLEIVERGIIYRVKHNMTTSWKNYSFREKELITDINIAGETERLRTEIERIWQDRWNTEIHGRDTYSFIKNVNFASENQWFNPSRHSVYVLTGYGPFKGTLYKRGLMEEKMCPLCEENEETIDHILYDCVSYENIRYPELRPTRTNKKKLIESKSNFEKFSQFVKDLFDVREAYLGS